MEYIELSKNRYLIKNSNGRIVSKKDLIKDGDSTIEKTKQVKRTNRKSKSTRD